MIFQSGIYPYTQAFTAYPTPPALGVPRFFFSSKWPQKMNLKSLRWLLRFHATEKSPEVAVSTPFSDEG